MSSPVPAALFRISDARSTIDLMAMEASLMRESRKYGAKEWRAIKDAIRQRHKEIRDKAGITLGEGG